MRTDAHAPSNFDPADYRVIDYVDNKHPEPPMPPIEKGAYEAYDRYLAIWQARLFEHFPDWRTGGDDHQSVHQCNHCGHPGIRWVAVVEHIPTGKRLAFGETCAERVELAGRDAFKAKFIKDRAAREQAAYEKKQERIAFEAKAGDVIAFLNDINDDYDSREPEFLISLKQQLQSRGNLSDKQIEAARKFKIKRDEFTARREAQKAEEALTAQPFVEGKRTVEGVIVSSKWQDSDYGGGMKMLVKQDDGNKVWGTMPEIIVSYVLARPIGYDEIKGMRIRFSAQVTKKQGEEHFGFFKRPTKTEIIEEVAA